MRFRVALLLSLALLPAALPSPACGDGLQSLRDDVRTERSDDDEREEPDRAPQKKRRSWFASDCDDDDNSLGNFMGTAILLGATCPFWGPASLLDDDYTFDADFPDFPYDDVPGSILVTTPPAGPASPWTARLRSEVASDFGDQERIGGRLLLDSALRVGIDTEWNYRYQNLPTGHDQLWTGDFNVVYRFAQSERVQFRSGLGVNWLSDRIGTDYGFNFTYGADVYPRKPWFVSATMDWGRLGHAGLFHGRVIGGVVVDRWELFTGYDYYDVGGTQINGLVAGVGIWLH